MPFNTSQTILPYSHPVARQCSAVAHKICRDHIQCNVFKRKGNSSSVRGSYCVDIIRSPLFFSKKKCFSPHPVGENLFADNGLPIDDDRYGVFRLAVF